MQRKRNGRTEEMEDKSRRDMTGRIKRKDGTDWVGLKQKDRRKRMKESGWKKWTGSRTGKNLTGREMDWMNKAEGWD